MTKPWKEFRQEIVRLYIQEGRTLREVQEIMRRQHGFNASVRSYRQQFDHWGVGKYKCKRRPRRGDVSTVGVMPPPSPPATPTLPPITAPFTGAKPLMTVMSGDPGAMDYCWPTHRPSIHLENRDTHPSRNPSVSQPLSSSPGVLVPCQPQSRAYQPHRTSLPIMSTHVDNTSSGWVQGRSAFAQGEATSRDGAELCSQRVPNPSVAMRDPLSSVYLDNKATLFGDVDWGVPRSAGYSLSDGDAAAYHGEQTIESRARPMQTYPSTSPCALVAAKGFVTASHLPLDRINIFGRDA